MFAVRTLAISRKNHSVLDSEAKISREEVKTHCARFDSVGLVEYVA